MTMMKLAPLLLLHAAVMGLPVMHLPNVTQNDSARKMLDACPQPEDHGGYFIVREPMSGYCGDTYMTLDPPMQII